MSEAIDCFHDHDREREALVEALKTYPCPICGKVPHVKLHRTQTETLWSASCDCSSTPICDYGWVELLWASYYFEMCKGVGMTVRKATEKEAKP